MTLNSFFVPKKRDDLFLGLFLDVGVRSMQGLCCDQRAVYDRAADSMFVEFT